MRSKFVYGSLKKNVITLLTSRQQMHTIMSRNIVSRGKGKTVPLQAWSGPEYSRKIKFPDFMTTAQDGGKVVSFTHRPPLPPGSTPCTHLEAKSTPGS